MLQWLFVFLLKKLDIYVNRIWYYIFNRMETVEGGKECLIILIEWLKNWLKQSWKIIGWVLNLLPMHYMTRVMLNVQPMKKSIEPPMTGSPMLFSFTFQLQFSKMFLR